jgi:WD40 repeat protein
VYGVALSGDAGRLASASGDGTVKVWNPADNGLLATLVQLAPKSDDWLIVTSDGWYATSTPASVNWSTSNLDIPPEKLANLQNAQAVRQTLAGEIPAAPTLR